jgi:hypothetical protein
MCSHVVGVGTCRGVYVRGLPVGRGPTCGGCAYTGLHRGTCREGAYIGAYVGGCTYKCVFTYM